MVDEDGIEKVDNTSQFLKPSAVLICGIEECQPTPDEIRIAKVIRFLKEMEEVEATEEETMKMTA